MFTTKADTLNFIKDKISCSCVEEPFVVLCGHVEKNMADVVAHVKENFGSGKIVVRSSSSNEDLAESSNAGHYESVLDVDVENEAEIADALKAVYKSYKADITDTSTEQILLQRQMENVSISGVVFSRDIKLGRPYYTISYADKSTDAVTSGGASKTVYIARNADVGAIKNKSFANLICAVKELETIFKNTPLDVEFGIDDKCDITIFQVRPFAACPEFEPDETSFANGKETALGAYRAIQANLRDKNTILSDMAFWNPSEIIGDNPHPLDFSLYREIITKSAYNQGLYFLGYKGVDGELMYLLGNKPYVSLHQSFLCLMPEDIDGMLESKLLTYYKEKLLRDTSAHDKIEFEVVFSSYDFTTEDELAKLKAEGFKREEILELRNALFNLTNKMICSFKENRMKDVKALNGLKVHRENIKNNLRISTWDTNALIQYVKELLESIKQYGTPKFARQARLAFIAKSLLTSLVAKGYMEQAELDDFMTSIYTVAAEYDSDFYDLAKGRITRADFDEKYGHLRAGTYDITCETYAERDFGINGDVTAKVKLPKKRTTRNYLNMEKLQVALTDIGFDISLPDFVDFLIDSMEGREYFKFEFTKSLSLAMDILILIGQNLEIPKENMAYLTIDDIIAMLGNPEDTIQKLLLERISANKKIYNQNSELILPAVIYSETQFDVVEIEGARPNFITNKIVNGDVAFLEVGKAAPDITDKIVVIEKADPGYDWIFAKGIKGFITKYGGVASHMAIRCAEFDIPAAIGCGDVIFDFVKSQKAVTLDAANGKIQGED